MVEGRSGTGGSRFAAEAVSRIAAQISRAQSEGYCPGVDRC